LLVRIDAVHTGDLHPLDNQTKFPSGIQSRHTGRTQNVYAMQGFSVGIKSNFLI
jgi:hypothetical protein